MPQGKLDASSHFPNNRAALIEAVRERFPNANAVFLFGSQAIGEALAQSNFDLYVFEKRAANQARHCIQQFDHVGAVVKVDVLPDGLLRSLNLLRGTVEDEIFCSTLVEGRILFDPTGRLAAFKEKLTRYPDHLRKTVGVAQLAKFCRALKVVEKAIATSNGDLLRSFTPKMLEHAVHFIHSQCGRYATRNWLARLNDYDQDAYSKIQQGYELQAFSSLNVNYLTTICNLIDGVLSNYSNPTSKFLMEQKTIELDALCREFPWHDPYDLEILVHRLRRDKGRITPTTKPTQGAEFA